MADEKSLKEQRDRFLAFSFASADLFLEISGKGKIQHVFGAAKGLTGHDEKELMGKDWLSIFPEFDQAVMMIAYERAKPGFRCGPILVHLKNDESNKQIVMSGIKMPGSDIFYMTLGLSNEIISKVAHLVSAPEGQKVLNSRDFILAARDSLEKAKAMGENVSLTLFDFAPTEKDRKRIGEAAWKDLITAIEEILVVQSFDGYAAAEISDGRYSLFHHAEINTDDIREQIATLASKTDHSGQGIKIKSKTITSELQNFSEREAARAIIYTIHEFDRKGAELTIQSLNSGFEEYAAANAQRIKQFQSFIKSSNFNLHFQPVVDLKTSEAVHYEILCRFDHGDTQEWVIFGEDIGLAPEFDIAMCDRAIDYINFRAGGTRIKFSINISCYSAENEKFARMLRQKLDKYPNLNERLMFEITESSNIRNLEKTGKFIESLQNRSFKVALDDFGSDSLAFQYLQRLGVDYVKLDGKYTRKLLTSQRDIVMVKNLAQTCKDLEIEIIAELVEEEPQKGLLADLGIQYGQGHFFGPPKSSTEYHPQKKPLS